MISYCTNYWTSVPDITIYANCDTVLAIKALTFDLRENDEFIFVIKNFDYVDSSYAFLLRARKSDINENGEIIFKITPTDAKKIKPRAFYTLAVLVNAFDSEQETIYKKLTENGNIIVEYGAQELLALNETLSH